MSDETRPRETEEEFFAGYCLRSGIDPQWAREHGFKAEPCDCEYHGCRGWVMNTQAFHGRIPE